jgi:hypothetical protein
MVRRFVATLLMIGVAHLALGSSVAACLAHARGHVAAHCSGSPLHRSHTANAGDAECCQMGATCAPWALVSGVLDESVAIGRATTIAEPGVLRGLTVAPETPPPRA